LRLLFLHFLSHLVERLKELVFALREGWMLATTSCGYEELISSVTCGRLSTSRVIVPPATLTALLLVVAAL